MTSNVVVITTDQIDALFDKAEDQGDYVFGLYKLVFPDWDAIETVNGFPVSSEKFSKYVFEKAIEWDRANTKAMAGGAWLNNGFSTSGHEGHWLEVHRCDVTYTE